MSSPGEHAGRHAVDLERQHRVEQFLYREADLLDTFAMDEWLDLVAEDVELRVPVRTARDPGAEASEFSEETNYLREDYAMLRERVGRLNKEYAWSENPRSRVRHVLGNVRILAGDESDGRNEGDGRDASDGWDEGEELVVANTQHVYRSYGDTPDHDLISARRETTLRRTGSSFEIAERVVYLDHSILNTRNLTLPLL